MLGKQLNCLLLVVEFPRTPLYFLSRTTRFSKARHVAHSPVTAALWQHSSKEAQKVFQMSALDSFISLSQAAFDDPTFSTVLFGTTFFDTRALIPSPRAPLSWRRG
jgi:hypothetical protein